MTSKCFLSRSPCCAKDSYALGNSLGYRSTKWSNFLRTVLAFSGLVTDVHSLNRPLIWNVGVAVVDADSKLWYCAFHEQVHLVYSFLPPGTCCINTVSFETVGLLLGSADGTVYWCISLRFKWWYLTKYVQLWHWNGLRHWMGFAFWNYLFKYLTVEVVFLLLYPKRKADGHFNSCCPQLLLVRPEKSNKDRLRSLDFFFKTKACFL